MTDETEYLSNRIKDVELTLEHVPDEQDKDSPYYMKIKKEAEHELKILKSTLNALTLEQLTK